MRASSCEQPPWVFDDGGRASAGFRGQTRDCFVRAVSIASRRPYREVYDFVNAVRRELRRGEVASRRAAAKLRRRASLALRLGDARRGVSNPLFHEVMHRMGWVWKATMQYGKGCTTHLRADELPGGRLVVRVSKHMVALIDGVMHDTHDPSREGTRCVYGYFEAGPAWLSVASRPLVLSTSTRAPVPTLAQRTGSGAGSVASDAGSRYHITGSSGALAFSGKQSQGALLASGRGSLSVDMRNEAGECSRFRDEVAGKIAGPSSSDAAHSIATWLRSSSGASCALAAGEDMSPGAASASVQRASALVSPEVTLHSEEIRTLSAKCSQKFALPTRTTRPIVLSCLRDTRTSELHDLEERVCSQLHELAWNLSIPGISDDDSDIEMHRRCKVRRARREMLRK